MESVRVLSGKSGKTFAYSYYFILDMVPLTLPIISCSKNLKSKINRKCIVEAIKVLNSKYANTLHLNRRARDGHIQKLIKGGVHPGY